MNFLCNELIWGRFFPINANDVYLFPLDNIIAIFPLHITILQKKSFCKACRMSMNVPEWFKFLYTRADLWAKLLLFLLMTTTTTMITMKEKRGKRKFKKPIKFDYNLKHSQAAPETFARQKCNFENAICWRWRISMKTLQRQMIKIYCLSRNVNFSRHLQNNTINHSWS